MILAAVVNIQQQFTGKGSLFFRGIIVLNQSYQAQT
jgi:hypothetical protein